MSKLVRGGLCLAAGMLLACGGGGAGGGTGESQAPSSQITVVFENNQFTDCTVYYDGGGGQRRLGRVEGNSVGTFRAPHSPSGFRIVASYTAVGEFRTQEILADPGNTVTISSHSTGNLTFTIR